MKELNHSVARAVRILDAFAEGRDAELGITDISQRTGLAKSVVSRVLAPLLAGGYLERDPRTRRYRVGLRAFELGSRYLSRSGAPQAALTLLGELSRETGFTAYLGELDGPACVVLAAEEGSSRLRVVVSPGDRAPACATAMGKAIMAQLDPEAVDVLLAQGWPAAGGDPWRLLEPDALRQDLAATRARGYALAVDDGYPGVWSVGTVLPWHGQRPMAVSLDVPAYAASPEKLHGLGRMLVEKMARFSGTVFHGKAILGGGG
ncbi:MAG: IclR family transcriptional regulator [Limnochordales bacterium]|nr:IclR family transcriptional regulator [Limnochordales bacterium]